MGRYDNEIRDQLHSAISLGDHAILNVLKYHMGWVDERGNPDSASSGKGLRPRLCLFMNEALGGEWRCALPAAIALELIHNFSLIHDDIQDGDKERRHRPTVWYIWGQPKALVAGNVMRILADMVLHGLTDNSFSQEKVCKSTSILTQRYLEMIEGQYLDLSYERRLDITLQDYLHMVSCKTGALMEASTHLGAVLGTNDLGRQEAIKDCGRLLGLGFQIRDDILGVWGQEEATGKAIGADILRKKKSFPVVFAMQEVRGKERELLWSIYNKDTLQPTDVETVLAVLAHVGAYEFSQKMAEKKCSEALKRCKDARLPSQAEGELGELADFILHRQG